MRTLLAREGRDASRRVARSRGSTPYRSKAALVVALVSLAGAVLYPVSSSGASAQPTFLGPLLSRAETPTTSWGRDGGFSLPLPNGKDFWIFGDTPRYQFKNGAWTLTGFIQGSSAAQRSYTPGKPLDGPLDEVWAGHATSPTNSPIQFIPAPQLYLPDGTGHTCTKANGGSKVEAVRWVSGAALMPDRTNILIPYTEVCVVNENVYRPEGWGFTEFNFKTNKFTIRPYTVFPATPNGASISSSQFFGSPIVANGQVTFFSWACCGQGSGVYTTTLDATLAALKNPDSYIPQPVPSLPPTFNLNVEPPSKTHSQFMMYQLAGNGGQHNIFAATNPTGPWSQVASGQLPWCGNSPLPCNSFALHPELSPAGRLIVSYHLPGYGPGVATQHPYPHLPLRHVVLASIPCNC